MTFIVSLLHIISRQVYDQNFQGVRGGDSSEGCLKWGGGVIKGSFQNILKQGVGNGKSCS